MPKKEPRQPARHVRLGFLVHDVSRLRRTIFDKDFRPLGVTRSQWWVLANLSRSGTGMVQTELAKVLDIGKVALGGLLDRLEKSGHIMRTADPEDRRAKRISMTPRGEALLEVLQERATSLNKQMLSTVTLDEVLLAEDILHRIKMRLVEMDTSMREEDPEDEPQRSSRSPAPTGASGRAQKGPARKKAS